MAVLNVNLTRIEGLNMKKSLKTARRGHKLLKDKLDELVKKFLDLVKENEQIRQETEKKLEMAYQSFVLAKAVMSEEYMGEALMIPKQSVLVEIGQKNIMSVKIPEFKIQQNKIEIEEKSTKSNQEIKSGQDVQETQERQQIQPKQDLTYGLAYTTGDLDSALEKFAEVSKQLLQLAENEKAIELLAVEIEKTRRRANALENVMIPNYIDTIKYIQMKLDENERASITRLMKVKERIVSN